MWCQGLVALILATLVSGLEKIAIDFSTDYFNYREIKIVCLLTCEDGMVWSLKMAKSASNQGMPISKVYIGDSSFKPRIEKCLLQRTTIIGVIIDPTCNKTEEMLYIASERMWFDSMHKWLIIDENNKNFTENDSFTDVNKLMGETKCINGTNLQGVLENLNISVDADIILASKTEPFQYELIDVFNFGKIQGGQLISTKVGLWSTDKGLDLNLNGYKYYRRWNFQKWSMRLISVVSPAPKVFNPETLTDRRSSPGVAVVNKIPSIILHTIADIHNFRFTYTITDRWIGPYEKNSSRAKYFITTKPYALTWPMKCPKITGKMFFDMGLSPMIVVFSVVSNSLYFREQDVSPVIRILKSVQENIGILHPPLNSIETRYYYRIPTKGPGKLENQFLRPLSTGAWCCVLGVAGLCAIVLMLSAIVEHRPSSAQYGLFSVVASICQQFYEDIDDSATKRVSTARKLTILVTGISCVLIYNYYTSSVVSWLLNGPPPSINSLRELLDSPLELIFEDIGYTRSWLQTPTYYYNKRNAKIEEELRQKKVFNKKKSAPLMKSLEEGIAMVKAGGYAYHTEVNSANGLISKMFTQSDLCELGSLQSMEKTLLYACAQKNSPYMEFLNWSLLRLSERGIVSCIQHRISSTASSCEGSSPRALALGGAAPAFLLLAAGYLLGTIIMLFERFIHKLKTNE